MKKTSSILIKALDRHKQKHGYVQYNRLAKREWFPSLDALLKKLRNENKMNVLIKDINAEIENYEG